MNRKEINAMTDEELCVKADELLYPGNRINFFCYKLARFYPGDYEEYDWVPNYPNDIEAAWELVEKLQEMELYPNIENVGIRGFLWNIWLTLPGNTEDEIIAQDENVKRAITKAFIMAMESE